jgi:hypothetical protein
MALEPSWMPHAYTMTKHNTACVCICNYICNSWVFLRPPRCGRCFLQVPPPVLRYTSIHYGPLNCCHSASHSSSTVICGNHFSLILPILNIVGKFLTLVDMMIHQSTVGLSHLKMRFLVNIISNQFWVLPNPASNHIIFYELLNFRIVG